MFKHSFLCMVWLFINTQTVTKQLSFWKTASRVMDFFFLENTDFLFACIQETKLFVCTFHLTSFFCVCLNFAYVTSYPK